MASKVPVRLRWSRLLRRTRSLHWLSIKQRFRWLLVFSLLCFGLCGLIALATLNQVRVQGPVYERIKLGHDLVADVLPPPVYIVESYLLAQELIGAATWVEKEALIFRLEAMRADYDTRLAHWRAVGLDDQLRHLMLEQSDPIAKSFYKIAFGTLVPAVRNFDRDTAAAALSRMRTLYIEQRRVIEQVVELARHRNRLEEDSVNRRMTWMALALAGVSVLILLVFVATFVMVDRSITTPINEVVRITKEIAAGNLNPPLRSSHHGETGQLLGALREIVRTIQRELVQSEKMSALATLVAGVAHELSTPISNCSMSVRALGEETATFRSKHAQHSASPPVEAYLRTVDQAVDLSIRNLRRATELVTSFKQVAVDRATTQRRCFNLRQLALEIVHTLQPTLKKAGHRVELYVPHDIQLDSFPGPLGQVISNIVENAAVHAFPGVPGTIVIDADYGEEGEVNLQICDNGIGMPSHIVDRVFEPFFSTRMGMGGSGLGLHIAHSIAHEVLGGQLTLRSESGKGCCFELRIPSHGGRT